MAKLDISSQHADRTVDLELRHTRFRQTLSDDIAGRILLQLSSVHTDGEWRPECVSPRKKGTSLLETPEVTVAADHQRKVSGKLSAANRAKP